VKIQKVQVNKANLNQKPNISIDEIYLKRAYDIRIDFENVHLMIGKKEKDIQKLKSSIESLKAELVKTKKEIKNGDKSIMKNVYKILDNLEEETQKLAKVIQPIEKRMEDLRKNEVVLHETLKEKYPHATDDELKDAIVEYIVERKRDQ
jgi:septal ring factor EnvC (AmiA/AmiB activator)